jgi:predicted ATPase with chaperone activity
VADLDGAEKISVRHVSESLSYREGAVFGGAAWRR